MSYATAEVYDRIYTEKPDYQGEQEIFDWVCSLVYTQGYKHIVELGCGIGQLARTLREQGLIEDYWGIDFSKVAIEKAHLEFDLRDPQYGEVPRFMFECVDITSLRVVSADHPGLVVCLETLEHLKPPNGDFLVLQSLLPGTHFIFSIPLKAKGGTHTVVYDDRLHPLRKYSGYLDFKQYKEFDDGKHKRVGYLTVRR